MHMIRAWRVFSYVAARKERNFEGIARDGLKVPDGAGLANWARRWSQWRDRSFVSTDFYPALLRQVVFLFQPVLSVLYSWWFEFRAYVWHPCTIQSEPAGN